MSGFKIDTIGAIAGGLAALHYAYNIYAIYTFLNNGYNAFIKMSGGTKDEFVGANTKRNWFL